MKKYTREKLKGLSKESLIILYAVNLAHPKNVDENEIMKIVDDCNLCNKTEEESIKLLVGN